MIGHTDAPLPAASLMPKAAPRPQPRPSAPFVNQVPGIKDCRCHTHVVGDGFTDEQWPYGGREYLCEHKYGIYRLAFVAPHGK